jgi:uncharacterized RDD family membrane protein YckC
MILHEVITTERVPFTYRVAGLGSRFLAWLVDLGLIVLLGCMGLWIGVVLEVGRAGIGAATVTLWLFILEWGYFLAFEWLWLGQTPGKRVVGLRVIQSQGTSVTGFQAAVRNIVRAVDVLPFFYGVGFVVAACNREQRRLGDFAADTLVVHVDRKAKPIRALQERRTGAGRLSESLLRQRLGQLDRQQKQLLLDLCLRREQLRISDRARLFQLAADYLHARLDLAADEHQSAEKFVLEMAAALGER